MSKDKKTFLERLSPYNFSFGLKLNLLVIIIIIISLSVISLVGLNLFKRYINKTSLDNLEKITEFNKYAVEKQYQNLLNSIINIPNENLGEQIHYLTDAFTKYKNDCMYQGSLTSDQVKSFNKLFKTYYQNHIIDTIDFRKPSLENILPKDANTLALQYNYIINSPYSVRESYRLAKADDMVTYSDIHASIHKTIQPIINKNKFHNIYIIERFQGNIIYSYNKNIALGNNIFSSYLMQSNLASIFQKVLISNEKDIIPSDFDFFIPELNKPVAFFGIPVFYQGKINAVLIIEITPEYYNSVLVNKKEINKTNYKKAISLNIIGADKILRNQPIEEVFEKEDFINNHNISKNGALSASLLRTGALTLGFDKDYDLKRTKTIAKNYLGNKAFISSKKLNLNGLNWHIIGQVESKSVLSFYNYIIIILLGVSILLLIMAIVSTYYFRKSMVGRINRLKQSLNKLAKGEEQENIVTRWNDEIAHVTSSFNVLKEKIDTATEFALELREGNYNKDYTAISKNDKFAQALNTLKQALVVNKQEIDKRANEDKIRNWMNEGIAKFNDILRQSNNNIQNLAFLVIENLIDYVKANVGGVFLVDGETENSKKINLIASFAYDRRKYTQKTIEIGEGLIGNCYLEKKPLYLKKLPQDYLEISSGLGKTSPNVLYIAPLLFDHEVLGFLEIASLVEFKNHEIELINKLAENIAATFSSVRLNSKTTELLDESKRRANEIAQQEEEMRQNMEEMLATQEELSRLRNDDKKRQKELQDEINASKSLTQEIINNMTGEVYVKDAQGIVILANEEIASRFNTTPEKLLGKSDSELFTPERAQKEQELDNLVIQEGIYSDEITELVGKEEQKYFVVKRQFHFPVTKETGVITIRSKR